MNNSNNIAHYYFTYLKALSFSPVGLREFLFGGEAWVARSASSIWGKLIKYSCSTRVHNKKSCAQLGKNFRETQKSWKPFEKLIPIWDFEVAATSLFVVGVEKAFPKGFTRFSTTWYCEKTFKTRSKECRLL